MHDVRLSLPGLPVVAAALVLTVAAVIPPRPLDGLARQVLSAIDAARTDAGRPPLATPPPMERAARERALEIAALAPGERMRHPSPPGSWLAAAGLPGAGRDVEKVILLRNVEDPAPEAVRLLQALEDTWALALSDAARAGAVGAARASDGWLVIVIAIAAGPAARSGSRFSDGELAALGDRIAAAVDHARSEHGLAPLIRDAGLDRVALRHARDLAHRGKLDHRSRDGATLADRLRTAGLSFRAAGENLALIEGATDPIVEAVEGWMASPGHRANILDTTFRRTGLAVAQDAEGRLFVVQVFLVPGMPAPPADERR